METSHSVTELYRDSTNQSVQFEIHQPGCLACPYEDLVLFAGKKRLGAGYHQHAETPVQEEGNLEEDESISTHNLSVCLCLCLPRDADPAQCRVRKSNGMTVEGVKCSGLVALTKRPQG